MPIYGKIQVEAEILTIYLGGHPMLNQWTTFYDFSKFAFMGLK